MDADTVAVRAALNLLCMDGVLLRMRHLEERILKAQDEERRTAQALENLWVSLLLARGGLAG